jgi:hypothetical protein
MSKSNTLETDVLSLIFNQTAISSLVGITTLYVSLHTADPGEGGTQATSETTYGSYARQPVLRTGAGWTVSAGSVSPVSTIIFPVCTSGTATITHAGVGTAISGAGNLLYSGVLTPNIAVVLSTVPSVTTSSTITED